jgi:hypothetical protein
MVSGWRVHHGRSLFRKPQSIMAQSDRSDTLGGLISGVPLLDVGTHGNALAAFGLVSGVVRGCWNTRISMADKGNAIDLVQISTSLKGYHGGFSLIS